MMKKASKILALILTISVVFACFSACGNKEKNLSGGKFTYWLQLPSQASETLQSYNDLLMYQEICKETGTDVEFISPSAGSTGSEAFQILLSSGDYPDMIEYSWKKYAGGADAAINDGVIIAINDYMEEYAPNYYDYMEGEKGAENNNLYKAQAITTEGNYYGFSSLAVGPYRGFGGIAVRKDLLDKWGLDIPVTIDDWENIFEIAKANGVKYPLTAATDSFLPSEAVENFNTAWEVGQDFYIDDGEVKFGPFEKKYKDYLAKMAEWMKKGYIDPDFPTNDNTNIEGYMTNGTSIASYIFVGSGIGKLIPAMREKNPDYSVVACPFPVLKEGDTPWFQAVGDETRDFTVAISKQCGENDENRYKEAIKWCDFLYSEEGMKLKLFGIEGDTYTVEEREDGEHYVYTDKIIDHEKIGMHSVQAALYHFMRPGNGPGFGEHPDYLDGFYPYEEQKDAIRVWNSNLEEARKHVIPSSLAYTIEESSEMAKIQASAQSDFDAAISNIILGKASIDTLDAAIKKAKDNGYTRLIEITQAAYDRYKKSL